MKNINILKRILDFILILAILGSIGIIVLIIFKLSGFKIHFKTDPLTINSETESSLPHLNKIDSYLEIIRISIYVYCVYLFRKVTIYFQKRDAFNNEVAQLFNWIGKLILISPFVIGLFKFISNIIKERKLDLSFDSEFDLFNDSFLITVSLGFFFIVLSEVFKMAKDLKEENELTI